MVKFDWAKFSQEVRVKIAKDNLHYKDVGKQVGVLPSTLTRVLSKGAKCDIDTVIKLCRWANIDISRCLLDDSQVGPDK